MISITMHVLQNNERDLFDLRNNRGRIDDIARDGSVWIIGPLLNAYKLLFICILRISIPS
jgi:hypothetical protein